MTLCPTILSTSYSSSATVLSSELSLLMFGSMCDLEKRRAEEKELFFCCKKKKKNWISAVHFSTRFIYARCATSYVHWATSKFMPN